MSGAPTTVVAFDVDGTLTTRDCVVPFLMRFARRPVVAGRCVLALPTLLVAVVLRDRDRVKQLATAAVLSGVDATRIEDEAADLARLVVRERLRSDTRARLDWHRAQGHRVVLVSASYSAYLHPLAAEIGAEAVLATEIEFDDTGAATGNLVGANCRGAEKSRRLREWIAREVLPSEAVTVWAYGDSSGDREMLAHADHPVWVTEPLASVAPTPR